MDEEKYGDSIINCGDPEGISVAAVDASLARHGVACLRGLFQPADIERAVATMKDAFRADRDHPGQGESPGAVMRNFQKLAIGGNDQAWVYNPRFARILYNPLWDEDIYGMHAIFRRLARVRNVLLRHEPDFAVDQVQDGLWSACRVQHYPVGGGFMAPHRDVVLETVERDMGVRHFYQILLLLTTKGEDFEKGGAYVDSEDGGRIRFEDWCGKGDIAIYDGASMHGVEDVDPHRPLSLDRLDGRLVAMVSLYKDMSADRDIYQGYDRGETGRQSFLGRG